MNKSELIHAVSMEVGMPKTDIDAVLKSMARQVAGRLRHGEEVTLPDIGKLSTKVRKARTGKNPRTGDTINIPAKRVMEFHGFKELRDTVEAMGPHDVIAIEPPRNAQSA